MSSLDDIGLRIEASPETPTGWGNAMPVLHEVLHGLKRLADSGESSIIDLGAIPFGPADEETLLARLGRGEVAASVSALGETKIWESGFPGVWLVDHYNPEGERIAFHIEISQIPGILRAQDEDLADSVRNLEQELSARPEKEHA